MEKIIYLYISKKNPFVWLSALCLLASAAARVILFSQMEQAGLWLQMILPGLASVLLAVMCLLSGEERLYKTAIPVWILGLCYAWWPLHTCDVAVFMGAILFCIAYTAIIDGRWHRFGLLPLYLAALCGIAFTYRRLPDYLWITGLLILLPAIRIHKDGSYHPTWGDRSEGRRIRSMPPMALVEPYLMPNRTGSSNLFAEAIEITQVEEYIRCKRREGMTGVGITHVLIAAYVRMIAKYPAINRFIAGQKIYSRGNDIAMCMTVKKELSLSAPDTVIKVHFSPHDTIEDVFKKFNAAVDEAKTTPLDSGMDNIAAVLAYIPGPLLKLAVWLLRALDYFGLLPAFLLEVSPFHGTVFFTSMASLGIRPVFHHLYDFGTIPVFCAFGKKRRVEEPVNGEIVKRKYLDVTFNLDDRICDGFYYASALKYLMRILSHPEMLDLPPEQVEQDIP
ncbi:MAG: hypothetical protein E7440_02675 [Ruminococcaceae bacterium]|nr:hypothetical protein [Oscillospiraceae bacterium]